MPTHGIPDKLFFKISEVCDIVGVEPYVPTQVVPSGSFAPVVVTVTNGSNIERDILMLQSEIAQAHPGSGSTYALPAALPQGGGWGSWISGYNSADWFEFPAQANRTASVSVTALDETGQPTETKLLPVIGIWQLSDQSGNPAPASTPSASAPPTARRATASAAGRYGSGGSSSTAASGPPAPDSSA